MNSSAEHLGSPESHRPPDVAVRPPSAADAAAIWQLVGECRTLDRNSPYAYLLLCSDFSDTSVVATSGGGVVGFVGGYRPPRRPRTVFVWQIGVTPSARRTGLGAWMLEALLGRPGLADVRYLEATVTASNAASRRLFAGFARRRSAALSESEDGGFPSALFPQTDHEAEIRFRIGPLCK